ncbi:MAG: hypothetical protein K2P51_05535 [Rhabdochlamydiaceae bacterium]|nr:hypothetical protein [Rhabdochlamydiaceae bacterium]
MKFFTFSLCFLPLLLWGEKFTTELRGGYFYPFSHVMREIYKSGGPEIEVEQTANVYENLNLWLNFNYFQRSGHSLGLKHPTSIHLYPLSLGVKYNISLMNNLDLYLGLGGSYTWANIHDNSSFVKQHIHRQGFGGVGKFGFLYFFGKRFFIDLYADYYYTKICGVHHSHNQSTSQNVGGLRTGLGWGASY